jgi:hypothetical protein
MWPFRKKKINYDRLITKLERGNKADINELLWQPNDRRINYLPVTTTMLHKLKRPLSSETGLTVYNTIENGNYELIIFNVPWDEGRTKLSPLIVEKTSEKVVGIMLPFNELHYELSKRANNSIGELGVKWVKLSLGM